MQMKRIFAVALILGLFAVGMTGCATPAGRTAGQVMDDATITTKVKSKIFADSILKGFAISIQTFNGEVTLMGAVNTEQERQRAGSIARHTLGVRSVKNLLKIK
jgi:hyperosmotically inducible protein